MKRLVLTLLMMLTGVPAHAYQVYQGCTIPGAGSGKVWYVDPVIGQTPAAGGLGTQAAPWNSLNGIIGGLWSSGQKVPGYTRPLLSTIPYNHVTAAGRVDIADTVGNPPVSPGDTIMLMSGNYGDITIGSYGLSVNNSDFVTIEAAPGQVPLFTTLYIRSTNKWVFSGVAVQSLWGTNGNKSPNLVTITDQGAALQTTDIIMQYMTVDSNPALSGWTQSQMQYYVSYAIFASAFRQAGIWTLGGQGGPDTSCISITNSHIFNVTYGANLMADKTLFAYNEIDHDGDDMIDYAASNMLIFHNYLHDDQDFGVGAHMDSMQGYPIRRGSLVTTYSNVTIDSNVIIRQTDPNLPFPTYLQGIDAFDGDWTNMTVTNNVIVTSSCWGISINSMHNSLVASNTVVDDGLVVTPGCTPWLNAGGATHEGSYSSNLRVTNNIAPHFILGNLNAPTVTSDHNVALSGYQPFAKYVGNPPTVLSYGTPGITDANSNVAAPYPAGFPYASQFVTWSPSTLQFDLHLLPGSVAKGAGTSGAPLPTIDITGATRTSPYSVGAYQ
jgi:Right handed beta helix region